MELSDWTQIHTHILQFEQEGLVTRTFRRLDPARQETILSAILDEAIEKGPTDLNIKQVAERAGVAVGSLYTYFGSREGVLNFAIELCARLMNDMFNSFRPFLLAMPLRDALTAYLSGGIEWSKTQAGLVQFFARAAYHGDPALAERVVRPIATTMREIVRDMLTQAAARGEIRPEIDIEATSHVINTLMNAAGDSQILPYLNTYFQFSDPAIPPEQMLNALLTLIWRGIGQEQL